MKIRQIIYLAVVPLMFFSCGNWLDITPKGQVEADDLLKNEKGYNSALDGVYYKLSSNTLYGRDLTYGMMDVLAKYWNLSGKNLSVYYRQFLYNYEDKTSRDRFDAIWERMYQAIGQTNLIIASFDQNRNKIKYSELIEGEAYALRAFMHMELAAMYGPVIKTEADLDKKCISYRTQFDNVALKFESVRSILTKAKEDLAKAMELLINDPILTNGRYGDGNTSVLDYHAVLQHRGARMNYFAAKALTMRAELALLNKSEAFAIAKELIDIFNGNQLFSLTNLSSSSDVNCGSEMLLSLYRNDLWTDTYDFFGINTGNTPENFCITPASFNVIMEDIYGRSPDGSGADYRLNLWYKKVTLGSTSFYNFNKLCESVPPVSYHPEIPIIRLSEIYYTACEANIGTNNTLAMQYLNAVRNTRALADLDENQSDDLVKEYLLREMRKEFIGEGRMFPIYKRMNTSFYVNKDETITPSDEKFVFIIPDSEYEYSPNEKPTNTQK